MRGLNRAFLIGHIQEIGELQKTAIGTSLLKLTLETPASRKVGDNWVDVPDYHRLCVFGQQAVWLTVHARKGDTLGVECVLKPGNWLDQAGAAHYRVDVEIERVLLLESRGLKQESVVDEPATAAASTTGSDEGPF